jgi:ABC-2 type transport system permease protein
LLLKELREIVSGRALWTMLLLLCLVAGCSFFQAVSLYTEASVSARNSPVLASGFSPLDGVLVPSFGALYLGVTLLFPFVAIRTLGQEKETGALRLLIPVSGHIGLWSKADSHMYFDDYTLTPSD